MSSANVANLVISVLVISVLALAVAFAAARALTVQVPITDVQAPV